MSSNFNVIKPLNELNQVLFKLNDLLKTFEMQNPEKVEVSCPFCNKKAPINSFLHQSCQYNSCDNCRSLYLSPRITEEWLNKYYGFMQENFCFEIPQSQRQARIENIMRPRFQLLSKKLASYIDSFPVNRYMEVGPGVGYFTEVAQQNNCAKEYILVEPDKHCLKYLKELKGQTVIFDGLLENCPAENGKNDLIFINSVIEHPFSLNIFFKKLHDLLNENGIIVLVDMHAQGVDIQLLRDRTPNINPYSILQVGSIKGIENLCSNNGLCVKEVFSIGQMDTDIIYELAKQLPQDNPLKAFENILSRKEVRSDLQDVLMKHLLTGYNAYIIQKLPT